MSEDPTHRTSTDAAPETWPADGKPRLPFRQVLREFFWLGCIAFGAGRQVYLYDAFVRRLRVITPAEFAEGVAVSHTLPGASVPNLGIYLGQVLHGWRGAIAGGVGFLGPGLILTILVAVFISSGYYPPVLNGGLAGAAAVAITLMLTVMARIAPPSFARVRAGRLIAFGTFLVAGPLHLGILPAVVTFGALSIWLNRPRPE